MARKRTKMQKIRDIIRVRLETQLSERQIARALRASRTVVGKTLAQFRSSGLDRQSAEAMSDSELEQALWSKDPLATNPRYAALAERFPATELRLKEKGMTLERLWQEYLAEQPDGYQYSQFCLHFQRWTAGGELAMHVEHKAGEQMYVDWAGEPLEVVNAATGEPWVLDVFVAILGASGLSWVQASESRDQACWIRANEGALRYFGGCPDALIFDYVSRHIIGVMFPLSLCGETGGLPRFSARRRPSGQHNFHSELSHLSSDSSSLHTAFWQ